MAIELRKIGATTEMTEEVIEVTEVRITELVETTETTLVEETAAEKTEELGAVMIMMAMIRETIEISGLGDQVLEAEESAVVRPAETDRKIDKKPDKRSKLRTLMMMSLRVTIKTIL
jgi:hypothetical protein